MMGEGGPSATQDSVTSLPYEARVSEGGREMIGESEEWCE